MPWKSISQFLKAGYHRIPDQYIVPEPSRPFVFTPDFDNKLRIEFQRCGRAWKLISKLDYINIDPHLVKYRIISLITKRQNDAVQRLGHTHVDDIVTHIEDDTSIPEVVDTLKTIRPFAIDDPNGLKHHDIDIENVPQIDNELENTQHTQINIPRDEETIQLSDSEESIVSGTEDNFDDFVSTEKQFDDIYLTEPNSEI